MPALDENDLDAIRTAIGAIAEVKEEISRAEVAGIDVSQQKRELADREARILQIKSAYFPNDPL